MTTIHRSSERSVMVAMRMSSRRRADLKQRAASQGMTVQAYLESLIWGDDAPEGEPKQQMELPMTG